MPNIRSILLLIAGVVSFAALALVTFSVTLAFGLALTAILGIRALGLKARPAPQPVRVKTKPDQRDMRVWNDGRGTIIDL